MLVNRYPGKCQSCNTKLAPGKGFAYKNGYKWYNVCNSTACMKRLGLHSIEAEIKQERKISENGIISMPYDRDAVPLIKSLPGAKWNPESKQWSVSILPKDLPRVLEVVDQLKLDVPESLRKQLQVGTQESRDAIERAENINANGKTLYQFQKEGVKFLALHDRALLADDMGLGKSLLNGTKILTPTGLIEIEKLKIGDLVIGRNGKHTKITGVFPQGIQKIFNVIFSDGRKVICSEDHLWSVQTPNFRFRTPNKFLTMSLKEIIEKGLEDKNKNRKWFIPSLEPIQYEPKQFLIHPYVLGALIANGHLTRNLTHTGLPEQREKLEQFGIKLEQKPFDKEYTYHILNTEIKQSLKQLGLLNHICYDKFIPEEYFFGSVDQRLLLLQGLVDNDGTVSQDGVVVEYNTSSEQLAKNVIRLVRSLGGVITFSTRNPTYIYKGEKKIGNTDYRIRIKLPRDLCPVSITKKVERFVPNSKYSPAISFEKIEPIGEGECTCISVDADDKLYVTEEFVVTHNTTQAVTSLPNDERVLVICPASLKFNWRNEINTWRPEYKVHICSGKKSFKFPEKGEIVIINYDILPDFLTPKKDSGRRTAKGKIIYEVDLPEEHINILKDTILIGDEFHLTKNYKASRSQKVSQLSRLCKVVWALTGTPLMNRPQDLFGVLCSGDMNTFGSFDNFVRLFNGYRNPWGGYEFGMPDPSVPELMKRVMLRRLKSEVLKDLPTKSYKTIEISDLGKAFNDRLNALMLKAAIEQGVVEESVSVKNINIEEVISKLEINDLPNFNDFSKVRALLAEAKIPAMLEIIESYEESDTPLIVFSAHQAPIKELENREGWKIITGETDNEVRQNIVNDFQNGKLKGVGLTIKTGGVGFTLTRASNALFVDFDWTPGMNIQAEDRLVRIGATSNKVLFTRLVSSHPLDIHIQNLIEYKMELAYKALEKSLEFKPIKQRPLAQDIELIEETEEELNERISNAEIEANRSYYLSRLQAIAGREAAKVNDIPEPELTTKRKKMLREALEYITSQCDGAYTRDGIGFSRPDAAIGHWLNGTGLREEDDLAFRVLERILCRYRKQLKENFEEIWKPDLKG